MPRIKHVQKREHTRSGTTLSRILAGVCRYGRVCIPRVWGFLVRSIRVIGYIWAFIVACVALFALFGSS